MREYGFSLTRILPYKDRIYDFILRRENTGQWKPVISHILCSVFLVQTQRCIQNPVKHLRWILTGFWLHLWNLFLVLSKEELKEENLLSTFTVAVVISKENLKSLWKLFFRSNQVSFKKFTFYFLGGIFLGAHTGETVWTWL